MVFLKFRVQAHVQRCIAAPTSKFSKGYRLLANGKFQIKPKIC